MQDRWSQVAGPFQFNQAWSIFGSDVRHAFALQILPTLPESEVRSIARAGTNMALKQAALRRLQGKV